MNFRLPPPSPFYRCVHRVIGRPSHRFGVSCRHFVELTLLARDRPLTPGEKFRRSFHFFTCSVCRGFRRQMDSLAALVRASFTDRPAPPPDPGFLEELRRELDRLASGGEAGGNSES